MKYLIVLILLASSAQAETNISTTLNMTGANALISGTAPAAVISFTTGYFKNISASSISIAGTSGAPTLRSSIRFTGIAGCTVISPSFNISGCNRAATGIYNISFTTPMASGNYFPQCFPTKQASTADVNVAQDAVVSPTTAGYTIDFFKTSTAGLLDAGNMSCLTFQ